VTVTLRSRMCITRTCEEEEEELVRPVFQPTPPSNPGSGAIPE
jgi:hypothetical protein